MAFSSTEFPGNAKMLFEAAVGQDPQLHRLLQQIAKFFDSYGCIMWEASSQSHLSMLGCWFPQEAGNFAIHDLPVEGTVSGRAHRSGVVQQVQNVQKDGGPRSDHVFLVTNDIGPLISVPVKFLDGRCGTLDLLRKREPSNIYAEWEKERFAGFAGIVPAAYQALLDRRSYELVRDIEDIVQNASQEDIRGSGESPVFDLICKRISQSFHSLETSLFLLNPLENQERYEKRASTWSASFERDYYTLSDAANTKTGWIIANRKPVLIFDLTRDDPTSEKIQSDYRGINWERFDSFIEDVIRYLKRPADSSIPLEERDDLMPLSYIAAPILRDDKVVGVIRCCRSFAESEGAGFYSQRDRDLLVVVAGQIAGLWTTYLFGEEKSRSAEILTRLAGAVQQVNSRVHGLLADQKFDDDTTGKYLLDQVLNTSLKKLLEVIPKASAVDIRRLELNEDAQSGLLRFSRFSGPGWQDDSVGSLVQLQKDHIFPVSLKSIDVPHSLGEMVVRTGKPHADDKEKKPNYFHLRETIIPRCRHTFCAPIVADEKIYGVLDILTEAPGAFSRQAEIAAEVMGSQLALYFSLFEKIDELEDLKSEVDDTYEDLGHQLKGPISQAYFRSKDVYNDLENNRRPQVIDVSALRGLCSKSLAVMHTLSFISGSSKASLEAVELEHIKKLFVEAAWDYERANEASGTTFYLNTTSWATCSKRRIKVDKQLLPQVVSVVCDNAMKYSYEGTQIQVTVEESGGRLELTIANKGLSISPEDIENVIKRGWRGTLARAVTAEGRGIGLFLCHKIMDAMEGELRIEATDSDGITRVKLLFAG